MSINHFTILKYIAAAMDAKLQKKVRPAKPQKLDVHPALKRKTPQNR